MYPFFTFLQNHTLNIRALMGEIGAGADTAKPRALYNQNTNKNNKILEDTRRVRSPLVFAPPSEPVYPLRSQTLELKLPFGDTDL